MCSPEDVAECLSIVISCLLRQAPQLHTISLTEKHKVIAHASLAASYDILISIIPLFRQESKWHPGSYIHSSLMGKIYNTPLSSFKDPSACLLHTWRPSFFHYPYSYMSKSATYASRGGAIFRTTVFTSKKVGECRESRATLSLNFSYR